MNTEKTCAVCGAELVPAKTEIKYDGSLQLDGSYDFNGNVCPKCHPELINREDQ